MVRGKGPLPPASPWLNIVNLQKLVHDSQAHVDTTKADNPQQALFNQANAQDTQRTENTALKQTETTKGQPVQSLMEQLTYQTIQRPPLEENLNSLVRGFSKFSVNKRETSHIGGGSIGVSFLKADLGHTQDNIAFRDPSLQTYVVDLIREKGSTQASATIESMLKEPVAQRLQAASGKAPSPEQVNHMSSDLAYHLVTEQGMKWKAMDDALHTESRVNIDRIGDTANPQHQQVINDQVTQAVQRQAMRQVQPIRLSPQQIRTEVQSKTGRLDRRQTTQVMEDFLKAPHQVTPHQMPKALQSRLAKMDRNTLRGQLLHAERSMTSAGATRVETAITNLEETLRDRAVKTTFQSLQSHTKNTSQKLQDILQDPKAIEQNRNSLNSLQSSTDVEAHTLATTLANSYGIAPEDLKKGPLSKEQFRSALQERVTLINKAQSSMSDSKISYYHDSAYKAFGAMPEKTRNAMLQEARVAPDSMLAQSFHGAKEEADDINSRDSWIRTGLGMLTGGPLGAALWEGSNALINYGINDGIVDRTDALQTTGLASQQDVIDARTRRNRSLATDIAGGLMATKLSGLSNVWEDALVKRGKDELLSSVGTEIATNIPSVVFANVVDVTRKESADRGSSLQDVQQQAHLFHASQLLQDPTYGQTRMDAMVKGLQEAHVTTDQIGPLLAAFTAEGGLSSVTTPEDIQTSISSFAKERIPLEQRPNPETKQQQQFLQMQAERQKLREFLRRTKN